MRFWVLVSNLVIHPGQTAWTGGDQIRNQLKMRATEVIGPYDVVVEIDAESLQDLYRNHLTKIDLLETVASTTTYPAAYSRTKDKLSKPTAFILIDVAPGEHEAVRDTIYDQIAEVQKADIILGTFDIMAEISCPLGELYNVLDKIVTIRGVLRTLTLVSLPRG